MSKINKLWQFFTRMSLIKQLWIAIIVMMIVFFTANILVNLITRKAYIEQQLETKNNDNAVSLAVSISQMDKDPVAIELMLSAEFDNGHYRYIGLIDPNGKALVERKLTTDESDDVPAWFSSVLPINSNPGMAQIQDGWKQYGTLKIESSTAFSYEDLWHGALKSLYWSAAITLLSGLVGTIFLKIIVRPLDAMVAMTEAISDKNFITIAEPRTLEFKQLAQAMNRLSFRIKEMFKDQSKLLEQLRLEANYEPVSGLMNRKYFISRIAAHISNEESFSEGGLIITHITNLAEINTELGGLETDKILKRMGIALANLCNEKVTLFAGRLTGADFAVYSTAPCDYYNLTSEIKNALNQATTDVRARFSNFDLPTEFNLVSKADRFAGLKCLVSTSKDKAGADETEIMEMFNQLENTSYADQDELSWRNMLTKALDAKRLSLAYFPVARPNGEVIHQESPVRLQLEEGGTWISAAEFITWAMKLDLITRIDDLVVEVALANLRNGALPIGLNVSTRAMCNPTYVEHMANLLNEYADVAEHLWLEVPEDGVFNHMEQFKHFCQLLKPLNCKIGVEHVGAQISRLGELHDLNLDYIKIDASVIRGIHSNTGNQAFLKGLCMIAHAIGLMTIAEGVNSELELQTLPDLGIDAMTGPGVRAAKE